MTDYGELIGIPLFLAFLGLCCWAYCKIMGRRGRKRLGCADEDAAGSGRRRVCRNCGALEWEPECGLWYYHCEVKDWRKQ
jgi:hypothetical protein